MSKQRPLFVPRSGYTNFVLSVAMTTVKMFVIVVLIAGMSLSGLLMGIAKAWVNTSPELDLDLFNSQAQTSFIYDKNGEKITDFRGTENRVYCSFSEIPEYLIDAVIAIEDARFFSHSGVDVKRYIGAFVGNVLSGNNQGGSTITCQLVKQTILTSEQTFKRKVQEAYLALELEDTLVNLFSGDVRSAKERILEEYLNVVYMGGSLYGVKIAAQDYFGKELSELSLKECAMIARMIRNPSRYNPRSNFFIRNTPEVSEDGANYVLKQMFEHGFITESEYNEAKNETLTVLQNSPTASVMYDNAYYVEYAIYDVVTKMLRVEQLEDTSYNRSQMEARLRTGGYHIYTALDPEMQSSVQDVISTWTAYPQTRYSSNRYIKTLSNRIYRRHSAAGRLRRHGLAYRRAHCRGRRSKRAYRQKTIEPRLPDQHARRLVHQTAVGIRSGL